MKSASSFESINLPELALELDVYGTRFKRRFESKGETLEKVHELLVEWKKQFSDKATLENLIEALKTVGFKDIADAVYKGYNDYIELHTFQPELEQPCRSAHSKETQSGIETEATDLEPLIASLSVCNEKSTKTFGSVAETSDAHEDDCSVPKDSDEKIHTEEDYGEKKSFRNALNTPTTMTPTSSINRVTNKNLINNCSNYLLVILIVLALIVCFYALFRLSDKNEGSEQSSTKSTNDVNAYSLTTDLNPVKILSTTSLPKTYSNNFYVCPNVSRQIYVTTYLQLKKELSIDPIDEGLSLKIYSGNDSVWPSNEIIPNTNRIIYLTLEGELSLQFVANLVSNSTCLYALHFINLFHSSCTLVDDHTFPVSIPSVNILKINNLTVCLNSYLYFVSIYDMVNIRHLIIANDNDINRKSVNILQEILVKFRKLVRLDISATLFTSYPIFVDIGSSAVEELSLSLNYYNDTLIAYSLRGTEDYFCNVFRNLTTIHLRQIDFSPNLLFKCKNLHTIDIHIIISNISALPNLSQLKKELGFLVNAKIYLYFNCTCPSEFLIDLSSLEIPYITKCVKHYNITSNCFIEEGVRSVYRAWERGPVC